MVLQVTTANNVKVYTVSGGLGSRSIPDWLVRQKKKALKKDFGKLFLLCSFFFFDMLILLVNKYRFPYKSRTHSRF